MDFTCKARFVAGDHVTDPLSSLEYASAVPRGSIRLVFFIAAFNDIDIVAADIGNT